eukprot:3301460-Lingulodinium_polyedra.AAC.1
MGAWVDGGRGRVSMPLHKLFLVGQLIVWVLSLRRVSPILMAVVLGRLSRAFEFRRPCCGALSEVWSSTAWG